MNKQGWDCEICGDRSRVWIKERLEGEVKRQGKEA